MSGAAAKVQMECQECGGEMVLKPSRFGQFWGCKSWAETGCRGSHGAHPDGSPMGTPADHETKAARIRAHDAFDELWRTGRMHRKAAYAWLQRALGLTKDEAHIGRFDIATCERLIAAITARGTSTTRES